MQLKKILIPVDFSENSSKIIQYGVFMAKQFEAEISVVFVAQTFHDYSEFFEPHMPIIQFEEDLVTSAHERMDLFLAENMDAAVTFDSKIMVGDVAEEILDLVDSLKIDMIVMGTHGYKGLDKILFGSVAEKIVKMASCPVLTVNPYK
jgi:nucleotide-binding universal stress UspA family protein